MIGIDVINLSIALQKYRLIDAFGLEPVGSGKKTQSQKAEPPALAGGFPSPRGRVRKAQTFGIDGTMAFVDDNSGKAKRVIDQAKSGKVNSAHIRDLGHTADR